ncbi:MAG TPA: hypothetical protein VEX37_02640 [Thermomicrobiales bacterium]|nr:hypothetical protein [Thermomicrobiales bacterium]
MTIQTLFQPANAPVNCTLVANRTTDPRAIVAAEGSELAARLRSSGWIARSGWRSHAAGRSSIWLVRFECPDSSSEEVAA